MRLVSPPSAFLFLFTDVQRMHSRPLKQASTMPLAPARKGLLQQGCTTAVPFFFGRKICCAHSAFAVGRPPFAACARLQLSRPCVRILAWNGMECALLRGPDRRLAAPSRCQSDPELVGVRPHHLFSRIMGLGKRERAPDQDMAHRWKARRAPVRPSLWRSG